MCSVIAINSYCTASKNIIKAYNCAVANCVFNWYLEANCATGAGVQGIQSKNVSAT